MEAKKQGSGGRKMKYGEQTVPMRIPVSMVDQVQELLDSRVVLEAAFQKTMLPKYVNVFIEAITEIMLTPRLGLILALKQDSRLNLEGISMVSELEADIIEERKMIHHLISETITDICLNSIVDNDVEACDLL